MTRFKTLFAITTLCACGGAGSKAGKTSSSDAVCAEPAAPAEAEGGAALTAPTHEEPEPAIITEQKAFRADEIVYHACPPVLPKGCEMAVLEGSPKDKGTFTMRVRASSAFTVQPHGHPSVERITVLDGTIHVGFGEVVDKSKGKAFTAGDFYMNPPGAPHYVWADGPVTLQITGQGPRAFLPVSQGGKPLAGR